MTEKLVSRFPRPFDMGKEFATLLGAPIHNYTVYNTDPEERDYMNPLGLRTIMGYVIPEWQRPLVWTQEQSIRFIESLWLGMPVGSYTINVDSDYGGQKRNPRTCNILVDGQQRMWALQQYLEDAFPVMGLLYSELNILERRIFAMIKWVSYESASRDEAYIREYYNRMNFGGTAHTEDQRA